MGRDRKPTKKDVADSDAEIENLRRGGSGKGDGIAKLLKGERDAATAEPLNMNPEEKD